MISIVTAITKQHVRVVVHTVADHARRIIDSVPCVVRCVNVVDAGIVLAASRTFGGLVRGRLREHCHLFQLTCVISGQLLFLAAVGRVSLVCPFEAGSQRKRSLALAASDHPLVMVHFLRHRTAPISC